MTVLDPRTLDRPTLSGHDKRKTHLRGFLSGRGFYKALEAMDFAEGYHQGVRKDGVTPEFAHQVYICSYLVTLLPHFQHPEETLTAAFLHDVCEDYDVPFEEIERRFGPLVATAVRALTKEFRGVKVPTARVLDAQAADAIASIVKAADRMNNQQTMAGVFSEAKIVSYIAETRSEIVPMVKQARRNFPSQDLAYQNALTVLFAQVEMLEAALAGLILREDTA